MAVARSGSNGLNDAAAGTTVVFAGLHLIPKASRKEVKARRASIVSLEACEAIFGIFPFKHGNFNTRVVFGMDWGVDSD